MEIGRIKIGDITIKSWDTEKKIYEVTYGKTYHISEESLEYQVGLMFKTMLAHGNKNLKEVSNDTK